jgi:hypothetical protein
MSGEQASETAALLALVEGFIRRFVLLPGRSEYTAVALFVLHTWAFDAAHATPYVVIESPEKRSGKTRLLEVLELLCRGAHKVASITAAGLFQTNGQGQPTILIDEADAIFAGNSEHSENLRGVLNAGNAPGSKVIRGGKDGKPISYAVYCPKVIAGIATGRLPDTIRDRAIVLPVDRKLKSERVERMRPRRLQEEVRTLHGQFVAWATQYRDWLFRYELPEPLENITDRLEEAWEPLLGIAHLAGGAWPDAAVAAAEHLASEATEDATASHILLLALRDVFGEREALPTQQILARLNTDSELSFRSWNDDRGITAHGLGRLLRPYRASPKKIRFGDRTRQGYERKQFESAWARYGSGTSGTSTVQSQQRAVGDPEHDSRCSGPKEAVNPQARADVPDVPDRGRLAHVDIDVLTVVSGGDTPPATSAVDDEIAAFEQCLEEARHASAVPADGIRRRVLDAVAEGRIAKGGPSEIAACGLLDDMPVGYWEQWSRNAAERIREQTREGGERRRPGAC